MKGLCVCVQLLSRWQFCFAPCESFPAVQLQAYLLGEDKTTVARQTNHLSAETCMRYMRRITWLRAAADRYLYLRSTTMVILPPSTLVKIFPCDDFKSHSCKHDTFCVNERYAAWPKLDNVDSPVSGRPVLVKSLELSCTFAVGKQ